MDILLPILIAAAILVLICGVLFRLHEYRKPQKCIPATVVYKCPCGGLITFEIQDGRELQLAINPDLFHTLEVGDRGRLTYRTDEFLRFEHL